MDARQRAIVANQFNRTVTETSGAIQLKTSEVFMRFCAEPFPDIFTVVSSSVSAGIGGGATVDKEKQNVQANAVATLAAALKESGTAIERSQTVNLLGMSLYRTCERYMNGAITDEELKIQASRDQQAMISILAIEQLTSLARPAPTKIILDGGLAEANATVSQDNMASKKALDDANVNLDTAKQLKELRLAESKQKDKCDFDDASKQALCDEATVKVDNANLALKQAEEQLKNATSTSNTKVGNGLTTNVVINDNRKPDIQTLDNETIKHIADTVYKLAELGTKFDRCQFIAIKDHTSEHLRECNNNNIPSSVEIPIKDGTKTPSKSSTCSFDDSETKFYVQVQKGCSDCLKKATEAKIIFNTKLSESCKRLVNYPIEHLDEKNIPNDDEIRYFSDADKVMAELIAKELKVKVKRLMLKASPHVIEYWVGKSN